MTCLLQARRSVFDDTDQVLRGAPGASGAVPNLPEHKEQWGDKFTSSITNLATPPVTDITPPMPTKSPPTLDIPPPATDIPPVQTKPTPMLDISAWDEFFNKVHTASDRQKSAPLGRFLVPITGCNSCVMLLDCFTMPHKGLETITLLVDCCVRGWLAWAGRRTRDENDEDG